jgi:hypothetical protein
LGFRAVGGGGDWLIDRKEGGRERGEKREGGGGIKTGDEFLPRAGIFKQSMGARSQGGIGLSYRPARLHRLAEFIPRNRFLGSINV